MHFQDDIMRPVWSIQVDTRPGAKGGYRNPTIVANGSLDNVDRLTDEEIRVLENPMDRIHQTEAWKRAAKKRDEILRQIRNR